MRFRVGVVAFAGWFTIVQAIAVCAQDRRTVFQQSSRNEDIELPLPTVPMRAGESRVLGTVQISKPESPTPAKSPDSEDRPKDSRHSSLPPPPAGPWLGTTGRCPSIVPQYSTAGYPPPFNANCPREHPLLRFLFERSAGTFIDPAACPPCGRCRR